MLLQHIAVTNHSLCTVWATTCSNKLRQVVLVKNYVVYSGELLGKSLSLRWATQIQNDFVWLVKITKLCCIQYTWGDLSMQRVAGSHDLVYSDLYYKTWGDKAGWGGGGVHGISSDGDDRMEPKVKTQKIPRASSKTQKHPRTKN